MDANWTSNIPDAVYFVIGIGGVAAAILTIVKLWEAVVPDRLELFAKDLATTRSDLQDIRTRVGKLETDITKIDQPAINGRFDKLAGKIDKFYDFLLEHTQPRP